MSIERIGDQQETTERTETTFIRSAVFSNTSCEEMTSDRRQNGVELGFSGMGMIAIIKIDTS
jgi:hypothetical protein